MGSPSERTLSEPLQVIRLHDPNDAPLDATGARLHGGRWNSPGADVVYAALTYAGAILETRVHANVRRPPPREIAVITIPAGVRVSELTAADVRGWDDADQVASRTAGDAWLSASRSLALIVPSKAGAPLERNVALNLRHADAQQVNIQSAGAVPWDLRLFAEPAHHAAPRRAKKRPAAPRDKK
jgi:RES domain-containing protein